MRRFGLIISVLALVLGLSQCKRQRPEMPHYNGPIGGKVIQHVTVNTTRDNGGGDSKVSLLSLTTKLKLQWDGTEKIYVYDGTCMCGVLRFSKYISADHSEATFVGEINTVVGRKLRFYHFNNVAEDDVPGFEGNNKTLSRDYSTQDAKQITSIIPGFVLRSDETEISSDGEYNGIIMKLPFSVMRTKFSGFGSSNIYLTGMGGTGYSIDKTGALTVNENTSATLTTPGTADFYIVFMPKVDAHYKFSNASGFGETTWTLAANAYYTESGSASGEAVLIFKRKDPTASPAVTSNTIGCSNSVVLNMGGVVTATAAQQCEYGLVYSKTSDNATPTIGGTGCTKCITNTSYVSGSVSFSQDLTGLTVNVGYSERAYVIGENCEPQYGAVRTFTGGSTPVSVNWNGGGTPGASPYEFTVNNSPLTKVRFSQGNLQYVGSAATPYWKFADHQFDVLGKTTGQDSDYQTVDRDLFGWGCTGFQDTRKDSHANWYQTNYMPYSTPTSTVNVTYNYYGYGPDYISSPYYNLTVANKSDWGYNAIKAGSASTTGWRTLTKTEWGYLLSNTNTSKWALGKVGSCTPGMIILPDEWTLPAGCTFTGGVKDYTTNVYSYTQWHDMESAGAVFLPAVGSRFGLNVYYVGLYGNYWSSSYRSGGSAWSMHFDSGDVNPQDHSNRCYGLSVRLVR